MANVTYQKVPTESTDAPSDLEANDEKSSYISHEDTSKPFRLDARFISDAVLGLSDGMTVPFALTAGLSELGDTRVVVLAGLAELVAGAISMGLGGYLAAKSEKEIYNETLSSTLRNLQSISPATLSHRISSTFHEYKIPSSLLHSLSYHISTSPSLPNFLMRFESDMSEPPSSRALTCAITIATAYFLGGFIPLLPYLLVRDRKDVGTALWSSVVTMVVTLFVLGYGKAWVVTATAGAGSGVEVEGNGIGEGRERRRWFGDVGKGARGGGQMLVVGGLSAGSAVVLVKLFNSLL